MQPTLFQSPVLDHHLRKQYRQARQLFAHIAEHPDSPWIVDAYIRATQQLAAQLPSAHQESLLLKVCNHLLSVVDKPQTEHCTRQHILNQFYRILNDLHFAMRRNRRSREHIKPIQVKLNNIRL